MKAIDPVNIATAIRDYREKNEMNSPFLDQGIEYAVYSPQQVLVFTRIEDLHQFVTNEVLKVLSDSTEGIIVPTGGTYTAIYDKMVESSADFKPRLQDRDIANLDEVWKIDPQSPNYVATYAEYMRSRLFHPMRLGQERWIIPDGTTETPDQEAVRIESLLADKKWALALLGIGPDAKEGLESSPHIGFIPKGTPPSQGEMFVQLDDVTYETNRQGTPEPDKYFTHAITMGPKDIARARRHILVAKGNTKEQNMRDTLLNPVDLACPSSQVLLFPETTIILDQHAARKLLKELNLLS